MLSKLKNNNALKHPELVHKTCNLKKNYGWEEDDGPRLWGSWLAEDERLTSAGEPKSVAWNLKETHITNFTIVTIKSQQHLLLILHKDKTMDFINKQ